LERKRQVESVYRIVDVVGESGASWEEAGRRAVETAATSIRDLRVAEVVKMDVKLENGKVMASDAGPLPPTANRSAGRWRDPARGFPLCS
jgi:flavin-binding protein dodecin